jgi:hypothetical protein
MNTCLAFNLNDVKKSLVEKNLERVQTFEYHDSDGGKLVGWNAFGPIGELMTWKQGYEMVDVKRGVDWMQKTFALLISYSGFEEQVDLTFTPTADACFHAFLQINPLWEQFENHIGRKIYHYPFLIGEGLVNVRNTTSKLFEYHFGENPFEKEEATSCSNCCITPNPPLPVPAGW